MKNKKIYYIETTLNGYITKRVEIAEWSRKKDYSGELWFEHEGEEKEYYEDIAGMMDELDEFLRTGSNVIDGYDNELGTKENVYLEYWYTSVLGYYDDRYIGIMIDW